MLQVMPLRKPGGTHQTQQLSHSFTGRTARSFADAAKVETAMQAPATGMMAITGVAPGSSSSAPDSITASARRPGQPMGLAKIVLPSLHPMHSAPSSPQRRRRAQSSFLTAHTVATARPEPAWGVPPKPTRLAPPEYSRHDEGSLCAHGLRAHHPYSAPNSASGTHVRPQKRRGGGLGRHPILGNGCSAFTCCTTGGHTEASQTSEFETLSWTLYVQRGVDYGADES